MWEGAIAFLRDVEGRSLFLSGDAIAYEMEHLDNFQRSPFKIP